jgi:hypothetical protein
VVSLIGEKVVECRQEEGAKLAPTPVDGAEIILFQETIEKLLVEILRFMRVVALPADVGIKRVPVVVTKPLQGGCGLWRSAALRGQNVGPGGGGELRALGWSAGEVFRLIHLRSPGTLLRNSGKPRVLSAPIASLRPRLPFNALPAGLASRFLIGKNRD